MRSSFDVIMIGGGVVGSSIAYFLAINPTFKGRVLVVERDQTYATSSSALSASAIRQQFGTPPNIAMSAWSIDFLRRTSELLSTDGYVADISLHERGYLFLGGSAARPVYEAKHQVQKAAGVQSELLSADQLSSRFSELNTDGIAIGSVGLADEGWFDGPGLHQSYRRKARELGIVYRTATVVALERKGSRITSVQLDDGDTIAGGYVINCAGAWSRSVGKMAGVDVPVVPRKRCAFVIDTPAKLPGGHFVHDTSGVWIRPEGHVFICGTTPEVENEPDDFTLEVDYPLFDDVIWPALAHRIPAFEQLKMLRAWAGLYEYNLFDHSALIGRHPEIDNFILATGFSGHGMMHSPATGLGVSELIVHGSYRTLDLSAFGIERAASNVPIPEHVY